TVAAGPNSKCAVFIIPSSAVPEPRLSLAIRVTVGYKSDPDHVERALVDKATKGLGQIPGLLAHPAPFVRLIPGFGESSLDFTLNVEVASFVEDRDPVPGADGGAARRAVRGVAGLRPRARRERALGRGRARRAWRRRHRQLAFVDLVPPPVFWGAPRNRGR